VPVNASLSRFEFQGGAPVLTDCASDNGKGNMMTLFFLSFFDSAFIKIWPIQASNVRYVLDKQIDPEGSYEASEIMHVEFTGCREGLL
jgi:hypothetical protein